MVYGGTSKGQIQVTFNWAYILIAGGLILLFFVGLVIKQQSSAQVRISDEVLESLESIFTAASVSENTRESIDISGLSDLSLEFSCAEGVSNVGFSNSEQVKQNAITPIFVPNTIDSSRLILWSMPYKLPFLVTDVLFVTSPRTEYVLVGETEFAEEFFDATKDIKQKLWIQRTKVSSLKEFVPRQNMKVRVIDTLGSVANEKIIGVLLTVPDTDASLVSLVGNQVQYYQKQGDKWVLEGKSVPIISIAKKRDPAKYAAVFSANANMYECNMKKAFVRLEHLSEIYSHKAENIITKYTTQDSCYLDVAVGNDALTVVMQNYRGALDVCLTGKGLESCSLLATHASELQNVNTKLREKGCTSVY